MKVVVTGYAGFIGSHLTRELLRLGHNVVGIDNYSAINSRTFRNENNLTQYNFDLENLNVHDELLFENVKCIFHLGAVGSVPASINNPVNTFQANVIGTLNILEVCRKYDIPRIIFSSSSSVYGDQVSAEKLETQDPNPLSPYAYSKLHCEHLIQLYKKLFNINYVIFRYFNVYGPNQRSAGNNPPVIPLFIKQIYNEERVIINGNGSTARDFTNVSDVVRANILAMETYSVNEIYNIATGSSTNLKELHKMILDIIKPKDFNISFGPTRMGDVLVSKANIEKAKSMLGFSPKVNLKTGLQDYINNVIVK